MTTAGRTRFIKMPLGCINLRGHSKCLRLCVIYCIKGGVYNVCTVSTTDIDSDNFTVYISVLNPETFKKH